MWFGLSSIIWNWFVYFTSVCVNTFNINVNQWFKFYNVKNKKENFFELRNRNKIRQIKSDK
jgi:hypothetical protein